MLDLVFRVIWGLNETHFRQNTRPKSIVCAVPSGCFTNSESRNANSTPRTALHDEIA